MIEFDILQPPPDRMELETEQNQLAGQKKQLIKSSVISDTLHGVMFLMLYLTDLLSGYAILVALGLGTMVAVILASRLKRQLHRTDVVLIFLCSLIVILAVSGILIGVMNENRLPGILAGLASGSLVVVGAVIGRRFFQVFTGLEYLKSVAEDEDAEQEVLALCNQYPELANYRQQAREILRPNLTFGELQAMREWQRKC